MRRNTLLITILFFGFPVLLFVGSYFYEFTNYSEKNINNEQKNNKKELLLTHKFNNRVSLTLTGNLLKRLENGKMEVSSLKIFNSKTGKTLASYPNFVKCCIEIKNTSIKLKEYLKLPIGTNYKWLEIQLVDKIFNINKDHEINILEELSSVLKNMKINFKNFKKEILYRKECGFEDIKEKTTYIRNFLGKLFVSSLKGDALSQDMFKNFNNIFKIDLKDKILNEWYKNLRKKVEIHTKK